MRIKKHWPEYLMEAAELGLFMFSACAFTVLLYHPSSPVAQTIHDGVLRRLMMGMAMGATAIAIIFSPLGQTIGSALQSISNLDILSTRKNRSVGCGLLHTVSIRRRYRRHNARFTHAR